MRAVVYPNLVTKNHIGTNPYIQDFIENLELQGVRVINAPHKNPLVSLFLKRNMSLDICFLHWIENVPLYKYGYFQFVLALLYIMILKLRKKKIVWFLHNKEPHEKTSFSLGVFLMKILVRFSDLIITHATDGVKLINDYYPDCANKIYFLDHPTKDRLSLYRKKKNPLYDLLIWGAISKYKGVAEFVQYLTKKQSHLRVLIIGKCDSKDYFSQLLSSKNDNIQIENRTLTFEQLAVCISDTRFVLIPYFPKSLLSSGILMDSLSLGAKIIGPNTGSFKDYSQNSQLKVYVFHDYNDIEDIIHGYPDPIDISAYLHFLNEHSWHFFVKKMLCLINDNK